MNTTENNKNIAEFLHGKNAVHPNQYHENWNELMQIVERIEGLETNKQFLDRESFNQYQKVLSLPIYTPIEAVYKSVIAFIDWYNENGAKEN